MVAFDDQFDTNLNPRPWIVLKTTYDVEMWIEHQNRYLQSVAGKHRPERCGIAFMLEAGGVLYLHTTQEGVVLLDVPEEAEWVAPLLTAATGIDAPNGQVWLLPSDLLTQLLLGLSPLLSATSLVVDHDFRMPKR
ncbi:hypothetical protein [uncultured Oxalicibacterium sp.]|uniref:hypothetical protein n=1 Tax=uncultured Oxalicibacterium sp. TaxID=1168540 RepID=UPI0026002EDB|nr:hypothetical protein [uncultured Oxalicibacterium sp.]